MLFTKKEPIIFLIAGRARSGKTTIGKIIEEYYIKQDKKVINSPYTKYLKQYIKEIFNEEITEDKKPRDLLQKISSELIKKELNKPNFFIDRQLEDLEIYAYFTDVIIISDVRFKEEIDVVKEKFKKAISIGVIRPNYKSDLTEEQLNDVTEVSLDNYDKFDYKITNNEQESELHIKVLNILEKIGKKEYYE